MANKRELIVVGGGIMGAASAWLCASRGMDTLLVEAERTHHEASWAAAGMLAPSAEVEFYEDPIRLLGEASQARWPAFARALEEASGLNVGYDDSGTIMTAVDRDHAASLRRLYEYQHSRGLPVERLSAEACHEREPLLSPRIHSGLWCPQDHQVNAAAATEAARAAARRAGVHFESGPRVCKVHVDAGEVRGVELEDGRVLEASRVLIAAGAWGNSIDGLGDFTPPVRPVKGQVLSLKSDPGLALKHVIRARRAYVVPKEGWWLVGATSEERGFDARVTAGGLFQLLEGVYEALPAALELEFGETWTGFRPASRDGDPIIGGSDIRGLFFCTGHYRHGIQLAAVSTEAATNAIFDEPLPPEAAVFPFRRFLS